MGFLLILFYSQYSIEISRKNNKTCNQLIIFILFYELNRNTIFIVYQETLSKNL